MQRFLHSLRVRAVYAPYMMKYRRSYNLLWWGRQNRPVRKIKYISSVIFVEDEHLGASSHIFASFHNRKELSDLLLQYLPISGHCFL